MAMAAGAAPDAAGTPVKRRSVSDILKYSPEEAKLAVKQMQSLRTKAQNGLKAVDKNYNMALREFEEIQKTYAEKYHEFRAQYAGQYEQKFQELCRKRQKFIEAKDTRMEVEEKFQAMVSNLSTALEERLLAASVPAPFGKPLPEGLPIGEVPPQEAQAQAQAPPAQQMACQDGGPADAEEEEEALPADSPDGGPAEGAGAENVSKPTAKRLRGWVKKTWPDWSP